MDIILNNLGACRGIDTATERLATILEETTDFVYLADPEGRIIYIINKAGRGILEIDTDEDVTTLNISNIHPIWSYEIISKEGLPSAIQNGVWSSETALQSRSGCEIPISHVVTAHKSADGKIEYFSTIGRDITKLKEVEVRLNKILNTTPIGIFLIDQETHKIPGCQCRCGYSCRRI